MGTERGFNAIGIVGPGTKDHLGHTSTTPHLPLKVEHCSRANFEHNPPRVVTQVPGRRFRHPHPNQIPPKLRGRFERIHLPDPRPHTSATGPFSATWKVSSLHPFNVQPSSMRRLLLDPTSLLYSTWERSSDSWLYLNPPWTFDSIFWAVHFFHPPHPRYTRNDIEMIFIFVPPYFFRLSQTFLAAFGAGAGSNAGDCDNGAKIVGCGFEDAGTSKRDPN
ncbi:hypothetical protein GALMADRAFT_147440 [Galerina marginata CBS 339.88]|uniref:Uncharacterized protein n=1 Tax=Galerina marginata (strain CBS 339.88) TaxID=685588 RepID=A0A067S867_GALM3|nr:hypothetical protein GALMADRAFT_147440 [Galerina marginata CBS 339.88]